MKLEFKKGFSKGLAWRSISEKIIALARGLLVGGFNPFEKYYSKWESSPNMGENKKYLKPPPRFIINHSRGLFFESARLSPDFSGT